eukprot:595988_1
MSNPPPVRSPPQLNVKRQLLFCVKKLLNVISRRQRDLRNKCIDVQKEIKSLKEDPPNGNGDKYWLIFQMSCESQVPPIVEVALDSIQKLMALSILTGQTRDRNGKPLIDIIVKTICNCCAIESEKVQLQIVKAILTLGTSSSSHVHGQSLLMCLRACYNIFLSTKNIDVQTSAKAVLTQIVCAVFQKMEKAHQLSIKKQAARHESSETRLMCRSILVGLSNDIAIDHKYDTIVPYQSEKDNIEEEEEEKDNMIHNAEEDNNNDKAMDEVKEQKERPPPPKHKPPKIDAKSSENIINRGKFGWCVLCGSPASHYCIQTRDPVCSLDCKMSNLQNSIQFLRTYSDINTIQNDTILRLELAYKSTILTNDGHILFRALCRQAHKTLPTDAMQQRSESQHSWLDFKIPRLFDPHSAMKPLALKSKVLSLELLRLVFSNTGHTFKSSHRFIDAVRECFVPVVTENAVSTVENIFQLAVNMFTLLVEGYRKYLKNEIGVLLDNVFLQIAESPHSNFKQKKMALTVFNQMCRQPQVLIGIFLNYDCGHEHQNIFQRIIDLLEKICSAKQVNEQTSWSPQLVENVELRRLAIEILVNIIRYANEWVVKANKSNAQIYEEKFKTKNIIAAAAASVPSEDTETTTENAAEEDNNVNESSASQHLQRYAEKKKIQQNILNAVLKFNLKPKEGIKYLRENELIEGSVESIVEFLKNTPSLNKTQIGDYLGGAKPYNVSVMHAFIDSIDFTDLGLDDGIRRLCTHFKLPGEAAQIDRIMQKFAETYCLQNEDIFVEADDAYILSYAIIMLNVALHHPQIKQRMTKEEFGKNNLLAVTDQTLEPLMHAIYDRIWEREIVLDDKAAAGGGADGGDIVLTQETAFAGFAWMNGLYNNNQYNEARGSSYLEQRKNIIEKVNDKVSRTTVCRPGRDATFYEPHSEDVEALQPMFSICWLASLATFSVLLEDPSAEILLQYYQQSYYQSKNADTADNKYSADQLIGLCLNGYRYGIKFASNLGMDVEAESYVNSLAGLTLLGTEKRMQQKNIEAIKTLLKIADEEGNILRKSWVQILKCVSELDVLHLIKSCAVSDSSHFLQEKVAKQIYGREQEEADEAPKNGKKYELKMARKQARLASDGVIRYGTASEDSNNVDSVCAQIDQSMIDKIYQDSVKLDSEGIVHFSVGLSCVSAMELDNRMNPRVFSLRKIVEVAHDNINLRIPLVWQRIWNVLSPHFVKAGCHPNTNIGAYAINSLRQLALLFFEKEELANFQFQNKFLIPFEHIMERTKSQEIRLLIVECIFRIVKARFSNVKSGWKTVFSVLGIAAKDPHEELSSATFKITQQILQDYFPLLKCDEEKEAPQILAAETLDECVNCLVSFSGNIWTDISLKAINNLVLCAQHLYDLDHGMRIVVEDREHQSFQPQKESPMIKAWFLCLTGLSRLIFDDRIEVRCKSLEALFQILQQHGEGFSTSMWELIFRGVLLPIFDDIYHNQIQQRSSIMSPSNQQIMHQLDTAWLETTGITALAQLIALFTLFFSNCRFMMDKIALLLQSGINQLNEKTAKISVKCWKILIDGTAHLLTEQEWAIIIHSLAKSLCASLPFAFSATFDSKCQEYEAYLRQQRHNRQHHRYPMPKYNKSVTSVQCMVHLIILDQLFNISINHADKLNTPHLNTLMTAFEGSYQFARDFNQNHNFRKFLSNAAHISSSSNSQDEVDLYFQESRSSSIILETLLRLCCNYIPRTANSNYVPKRTHKAQFMHKLYDFCNHLVETYCGDAAVEPFSLSTSPSINIQKHTPTQPAPSIPHHKQKKHHTVAARAYKPKQAIKKKQPINLNHNKGLRWKTGVIVMLLDSILDDSLWQNQKEQEQFVLNLYDYLILCIAIDNREIRQRISKLFGHTIKNMLVKGYPGLLLPRKKKKKKKIQKDDDKATIIKRTRLEPDTNRIVAL